MLATDVRSLSEADYSWDFITRIVNYFVQLEHYLLSISGSFIFLNRGRELFASPNVQQLLAEQLSSLPLNMYPSPLPDQELYDLLMAWLFKKGVLPTSPTKSDANLFHLLITAGGTTQLLQVILQQCCRSQDIILLPVPSYGLFFTAISNLRLQVKLIRLSKEDDWLLTPELLSLAIEDVLHEIYIKHGLFLQGLQEKLLEYLKGRPDIPPLEKEPFLQKLVRKHCRFLLMIFIFSKKTFSTTGIYYHSPKN
ncbi:MAG: aminotransferase class I/II-fold pyridoxal phosphate-dependent enzyme [Coxiellaceae bacterium]|nr:MAG: aminotransferase class I/II-fold pyridoxal phosphate-dependent enzyme [Coxiellaceae bacterium]